MKYKGYTITRYTKPVQVIITDGNGKEVSQTRTVKNAKALIDHAKVR